MIQMSALTLDWKQGTHRCPWPRDRLPQGGRQEERKGQKRPSNGHFHSQNTWICLPSHKTTAPPNWRHSSDTQRSGKSPECEAPAHQKPRCPGSQKHERFQPSWKGASKARSTAPPSPGRRQTQRGDLSRPSPWTNQGQSGKPWTLPGLGLCPARVPLPEATSAATALLPSCFHARPYFCQLSTVAAATSLTAGNPPPACKGKTAGAVPLPLLLSPSVLIPTPPPPPLPSQLPIKGVLLPGVDSVLNTHHVHSFIQLASEGFLHSKT